MLEFPRAVRQFESLKTWQERYEACCKLATRGLRVKDVVQSGFFDSKKECASLSHADISMRVLNSRQLDCGAEYALHQLNFCGVVRFVTRELLRIRECAVPLEYGAMLISMLGCPEEDWVFSTCESQLDELARDCSAHVPTDASPELVVRIVINRLNTFGVRAADSESYYDARNSYLHHVVSPNKHGFGIPITLSVVTHAVLRRMGRRENLVLLNTSGSV